MNETGFIIPPKLYDFLKYFALVILPAFAALVLGLGLLLNWSPATVMAAIITLVDTFLGTILGKSSTNFKTQSPGITGDLVFGTDENGATYTKRISINEKDPIFPVGGQVVLNVKHEQELE